MNRDEAKELCICPICPTFLDCAEEIAFCLATGGTSRCMKIERGCLCPGCPVHEQENFEYVYYCIRGSETEQR